MLTETTRAGTVSGSVGRTYDNSLRLTSLNVNRANPVSYSYDDDSLLLSVGELSIVREPETGRTDTVTVGSVTTEWTYTDFGEPESIVTKHDGTVIYSEVFVYDKRGWITDLTRIQGGAVVVESFGYDHRGRLETVQHDGIEISSYSYDVNSNRKSYQGPFGDVASADTRYDARDRLLEYGPTSYSYTDGGELKSKSVGDQVVRYDYDVFGNLRRVEQPSGTVIDYVIDGSQRRIGKKVDGVLTKAWLYQDGLNPIAELDGSGNIVTRFVYGTRPNVPDYLVKDGAIYRIIADHLGSPRLVVDASTGVVAQELRYDEFGRVTLDTSPGFQSFGFAGGLYDHQTGLVRFGARDYDPEVGRWTATDPIGFRAGSSNLYLYALANPINFFDPDGLQGVGHHYMPKSIFRNTAGLSPEASRVFNKTTTGPVPGGHGWSREHKAYNQAVSELWDGWLAEKGLKPSDLTRNHAQEFLAEIVDSTDPRIHNFLSEIDGKIGKRVSKKLGKKALTASCAKLVPAIGGTLFAADWMKHGLGYAMNEALWPVSELWKEP